MSAPDDKPRNVMQEMEAVAARLQRRTRFVASGCFPAQHDKAKADATQDARRLLALAVSHPAEFELLELGR